MSSWQPELGAGSTFQLQINGFCGTGRSRPRVTVALGLGLRLPLWVRGLSIDLSNGANAVRVVGLPLRNSTNGNLRAAGSPHRWLAIHRHDDRGLAVS